MQHQFFNFQATSYAAINDEHWLMAISEEVHFIYGCIYLEQ